MNNRCKDDEYDDSDDDDNDDVLNLLKMMIIFMFRFLEQHHLQVLKLTVFVFQF